MSTTTRLEQLQWLNQWLLSDMPEYKDHIHSFGKDEYGQFKLFRALMNVREPSPVTEEFLDRQDAFLAGELTRKGVTEFSDLKEIEPNIYLWKGDITRLEIDAIVNAANKTLLGCMKPLHNCVDNAIHTYAGVQLRQACFELILEQGYEEPVGMAKITPAYNLPSAFVIHTVGPKIGNQVTAIDEDLLIKSYLSVLALAEKNKIESIAIPCISTGDFNFPKQKAAEIAIKTVKSFIDHSEIVKKVIFNVFDDENLNIYQKLLAE